jgi:hypothetical protein
MAKKEQIYVANEKIEYRSTEDNLPHILNVGESLPKDMSEDDREALLASKAIALQDVPAEEFIEDR